MGASRWALLLSSTRRNPYLAKAQVIVYSRPGCHLCDKAKAAIRQADCAELYTLEEIDIETSPILLEKYQNDIPVVTINGVEAFKHRVNPREFEKKLSQLITL
jgi:glutaredoxin